MTNFRTKGHGTFSAETEQRNELKKKTFRVEIIIASFNFKVRAPISVRIDFILRLL